jgi:hypothetical protein
MWRSASEDTNSSSYFQTKNSHKPKSKTPHKNPLEKLSAHRKNLLKFSLPFILRSLSLIILLVSDAISSAPAWCAEIQNAEA